MLPFQQNVSSKFGAPMGRESDDLSDFRGKVHLRYVPFVDGDYDAGGAYWGGGMYTLPLYCLWDDEGHVHYLRAATRDNAKGIVRLSSGSEGIKFYR